MSANIKSSFFKIIIFSLLDEKRKLELVKYNKNLKNKLNISLINYKLYTGKYIICEKGRNGKEYIYKPFSEDRKIYEGEYLNGKRNGKGKEYNERGYLIFEGEFLNGKRYKGKEYFIYPNKLSFEGYYLNGKRWNGKGYGKNNKKEYKLKNGCGYIKEYYKDGTLLFEGEYLNGEKHGKGKEYYSNGKPIFEGEYKKGKRWNGKGYDRNNNEVYELKNGKGYIKEYFNNSLIFQYEEEYLNGEKNGKAKEYNNDGLLIFEGGKRKRILLDWRIKI